MKPGQRVIIVANRFNHGLEIGSIHVIEDTVQWKDGTKEAFIGHYYVPFSDIKEAEDEE